MLVLLGQELAAASGSYGRKLVTAFLPSSGINHIGIGRVHGHLLAVHPICVIRVLNDVREGSVDQVPPLLSLR